MFDSRFSVGHRTRMAELDPSSVIVAATKDDSNRRNKSTNQMEWEMERTWTGINLDANILCGDATDGDGEEESFQHHLGKKMVNAGSRLSEREREKRTRTEVFEKLATATIITTVFIKWRGYSPPDRWFIRFVHPLMQQPPAMASSPRFGCSSSATRNQGRRRYGRCFLPVSMSTPFSISLSLSLSLFPLDLTSFQNASPLSKHPKRAFKIREAYFIQFHCVYLRCPIIEFASGRFDSSHSHSFPPPPRGVRQ